MARQGTYFVHYYKNASTTIGEEACWEGDGMYSSSPVSKALALEIVSEWVNQPRYVVAVSKGNETTLFYMGQKVKNFPEITE